ncbi:MAG: RNA 2',3'-cyclic phosphodiesterase [Solirubrobacterales bacterium]|nr:RNA 2',3'-cyclic phosphodiesterase [Solirubrobacterales bacterium]
MKGRRQKQGQRVFVALDPPAEVCSEAEAWARHIARSTENLRVVPARNSHITLAFLGERDEFEIEEIIGVIAETTGPVSGLSLGAPAWLPKRRPRNLVIDIHDDRDELTALQARLARGLHESIGWKQDRPYRPHLTCARTGRGFDPVGLRLPVSPSIAFEAVSVTLYSSHLRPEGAEYEVLERFDQ